MKPRSKLRKKTNELKKLVVAGLVVASALTLSACSFGSSGFDDGYSLNGGLTSRDWDMGYPSVYNNNTYCSGGIYQPLTGNQFSCSRNGVTTPPSVRPAPVVPPKSQQQAPPQVQQQRQQQQQNLKPANPNVAPAKPMAPAPKAPPAPPAKSGK